MPIDIREFLKLADQSDYTPNGRRKEKNGQHADTADSQAAGKWQSLFVEHPESGGPFGGRNKATVALTGFLRAKSFPYEGGRFFALRWNQEYCNPPQDESEVLDIVSRAWWRWQEGGMQDEAPEDFTPGGVKPSAAGAWGFLTFADMEAEEERVGKLTWILPNVLPVGGLVYLSAPPAGAKSWLLLDLVRALVQGGEWIGKYKVPQTGVLYIDEEMGVRKALPRLKKLGVSRDDPGFWYTNKAGVRFDLPADVQKVLEFCTANGVGVVFVDTLTRVHKLDENDNSQMKRLFERFSVLMEAGITVIVAHHDRKGGVGESQYSHERMRGAGEISASADMSYSVDRKSGFFRLMTTKGRLIGEDDYITVDFVIEDNETKTKTTLRECRDGEKSEKTFRGIETRILDLLGKSGPLNTQAIKDNVEGGDGVITAALRGLLENRLITESKGAHGSKIYGLSEQRGEGDADG